MIRKSADFTESVEDVEMFGLIFSPALDEV